VLDKLEYLNGAVARAAFRRAAETCGVTQADAVGRHQAARSQLGVLLVQRGSRFIASRRRASARSTGRAAFVGDARAMREEIKALQHGLAGGLRIAAIRPRSPWCVADDTVRARHPNVRFTSCRAPRSRFSHCWRISRSTPA